MPGLRVHCKSSEDRTGFNFKKLHEWIDEPHKKHGPDHRKERHAYNRKEAKQIKDFWDKEKGKGGG